MGKSEKVVWVRGVNFTKENLQSVIDSIREQRDKDKAYWDGLCTLLQAEDIPVYDNSSYETAIFSSLSMVMNEACSGLVRHYCNELDFGRAKGSTMTLDMLWDSIMLNVTKSI